MNREKVRILKGCRARNVSIGAATVLSVQLQGAEYGHSVRVVMHMPNNVNQVWYARHVNRLSDAVVNLNDGNPLHMIKVSTIRTIPSTEQ